MNYSIEGEPENLAAVVSLAAMGLLTDDEALIDAALSEILALPLEERHSRDPERDIENLLMNHYIAEVVPNTLHLNLHTLTSIFLRKIPIRWRQ